MTSLDFIMDMDTEDTPQSRTINKNDGGSISPGPTRSQDPDPSRAATSSHEKLKDSNDRLTTASTRRRGHSSRSPKPTAPSSSSLASSSSRPPPLSRRSTASSEPMDPSAYGGHIQGSSSSNMPTRPIGSSPSEGNVPVKLTPITGRVSRAKKGVPVHTCEICKPPKTFTRAEHLRRHQLSHKNPGYPCTYPGCDKAFHRADLLARHAQRHEQDDKASSRGTGGEPSRPTSAASDDRMSYMHHGMGGGSVSRPVMPGPSDMSQGGAYPGNLPSYHHSMDDPGTSSGQTPMSPYSGQRESYPSSSAPQGSNYTLSTVPIISNQPPSVVGSPVSGTPFGLDILPRTSSPFSMYMDAGLPSLTIPDNSLPPGLVHTGHDGSPWPSSASESNYSTPSEISHRRNIPREYESPTSDWQNHSFYSGASPNLHSPGAGLDTIATSAPFFGAAFSPTAHNIDHALGLPMPFADDNTSFVEHPQQYHPYSSVRSPTPPTISLSAQPAETLVTLAAPISDAASMGGRQKGSTMLLGPLRGAAFLTANTLSPHVRKAIPKYLEVYWKRFDTLFPLVHRKSIKTAADEVLCCAMAAIGTQFLQGKEDRIRGNELHEFAWKEVNLCAQWTLPIMQAILLCEFYARFRGRSAQRNASKPFQSLYSRDYLFSFVLSSPNGRWYPYSTSSSSQMANSQIPDNLNSTSSTHDRNWNEWMEYESRRRLLAACFVLDVHTSVYYQQNLSHQFPISTLPIPLIRPTEDLWAAQSQESWETLLGSRPMNTGPADLSEESLTAEQVANAPYLDHAVFLASEALRLPRRSSPSILDLSVEVDETTTEGISRLFPGSAVGNTYLALYYTPLHDLLAVSGDTWLFSKKVASSQIFEQHKNRFQRWLGSPQATTAARFAAKALVAFLDHSNCNTLNSTVSRSKLEEEEDQDRDRNWNMSDISDYWAMYVCALICWALGLRAIVRGSSGSGLGTSSSSSSPNPHHPNANAGEKGEREALKWLKTVAGLSADKALNVRGRKEITGVVGMVKRRLEDEALGSRSRLLVDAARTLKNLEERVNHKWF
ncbi:choline-phosphate cytidylyltransferase [Hypoxylon texense]